MEPTSPALQVDSLLLSHQGSPKVLITSLVAQMMKNLPAMQETLVQFLGQEDPLEKG